MGKPVFLSVAYKKANGDHGPENYPLTRYVFVLNLFLFCLALTIFSFIHLYAASVDAS
jgi:hypothetical protein